MDSTEEVTREHRAQAKSARQQESVDTEAIPATIYVPTVVHRAMKELAFHSEKKVSDIYLEAAGDFLSRQTHPNSQAVAAARARLESRLSTHSKGAGARGSSAADRTTLEGLSKLVSEQGRTLAMVAEKVSALADAQSTERVAPQLHASERESEQNPDDLPVRQASRAPIRNRTMRADEIIIMALTKSAEGLSSQKLNEQVQAAGMQTRAAQKARVKLKREGKIHQKPGTDIWCKSGNKRAHQ